MLLTYVNSRKLAHNKDLSAVLEGLSDFNRHADSSAIGRYFTALTDRLFSFGEGERIEQKQEIVAKVDAIIVKSSRQNVTLSQLAESVHLSPYYLSRLYHAEMGISISERIKQLKLALAKDLLLQEGLKVQNVAVELGFDNVPYFTKFFKKNVGMTPQEYKLSRKG